MTFEWSRDVAAADWWVSELHPFAQDVGALVTGTFPAVARIFHPVIGNRERRRRWQDVAAASGRVAHPAMQFDAIASGLPHDIGRPRAGTLDRDTLQALAGELMPFTATPDDGWFAVWEGFGQLSGNAVTLSFSSDGPATSVPVAPMVPSSVLAGARVEAPYRRYLLLRGPISAGAELFDMLGGQSPNVWWPQDQAWLVATEIDLDSTYVAGSIDLIASVLTGDELEVLVVPADAGITFDSDELNPLPDTANR